MKVLNIPPTHSCYFRYPHCHSSEDEHHFCHSCVWGLSIKDIGNSVVDIQHLMSPKAIQKLHLFLS